MVNGVLQGTKEISLWEGHRQCHTGMDRTTRRVQADWVWPGMKADVRWLVSACKTSQDAKHSNSVSNRHGLRLQTSRLWQLVFIDIVGPLNLYTKREHEDTGHL